jgi:hypothetical protein
VLSYNVSILYVHVPNVDVEMWVCDNVGVWKCNVDVWVCGNVLWKCGYVEGECDVGEGGRCWDMQDTINLLYLSTQECAGPVK